MIAVSFTSFLAVYVLFPHSPPPVSSPPAIVFSDCSDLASGMHGIMAEFGVRFDVSETEFTIRSGQRDMELGRLYTVKSRNSDTHLFISSRFDYIFRNLKTAWPILSKHVEERSIRSRSGQMFGTDRWGYLNNGMRWRYTEFLTGDAAGYEPLPPREASLLDQVVSSACLGKSIYR